MKISDVKTGVPLLEITKLTGDVRSKEEDACAQSQEMVATGEPNPADGREVEPVAVPPLLDFERAGVRNDFSSKYRRAQLAVEGTIYRLITTQAALLNENGDAGGVVDLPFNGNLQQTADEFAALAHLEAVKFRNGD